MRINYHVESDFVVRASRVQNRNAMTARNMLSERLNPRFTVND